MPGAVSVIVAIPATTMIRKSIHSPKPGGSLIFRPRRVCQAIILATIGTARMTHMKSAMPSAHQSG